MDIFSHLFVGNVYHTPILDLSIKHINTCSFCILSTFIIFNTTHYCITDTSINNQRYILETLSMTTVTERQVIKEIEERKSSPTPTVPPGGSPISGILKGGRLWKQSGAEINNQPKVSDLQQVGQFRLGMLKVNVPAYILY